MQIYLCVLALIIQYVPTYMVWRGKWNIPAHIGLGFCVTAYIVPGLLTQVWNNTTPETVDFYCQINIWGAIAITIGTFSGYALNNNKNTAYKLNQLFDRNNEYIYKKKIEIIAITGIIGMCLAYAIMGFIPMFAENPLIAKQFKGEYFEPYYRAAYLFRFSFSLLLVSIPLSLCAWYKFKSKKNLFYAGFAGALIAISLARASAAMGILTFIGILVATRGRWFKSYMTLLLIIFPLGSAGYLLLGAFLGVESLTTFYSVDSPFDIIASGAPDIADQLIFLEGFKTIENFTYGRTFFGGLVPGNFQWNPSVWTLTYDNLGADISEIVSGGLRLTPALWGYASFGWLGVFLLPFASGFFSGYLVKFLKFAPLDKSPLAAGLIIMLFMTLGKQATEFYLLSIHSIPAIACMLYITRARRKPKKFKAIQNDCI